MMLTDVLLIMTAWKSLKYKIENGSYDQIKSGFSYQLKIININH